MRDYQAEIMDLEREIAELKTAQTKPGNSAFFTGLAFLPAGTWTGAHTWTIQFEDVEDDTAPIIATDVNSLISFLPYASATNTQQLEWFSPGSQWFLNDQQYIILSSRPIESITFNG